MSRVEIVAAVTVYEDDGSPEWGKAESEIAVKSYWNDDRGEYATLHIGDHHYTVVARDLRVALDAVTLR